MAYRIENNPVDLTEDEDSRDTITDVPQTPPLSYFKYAEVNENTPSLKTLNSCTPPPLTPICEINSLRARKLLGNQHRSVPKLKHIQKSSSQGGHSILSEQLSLNQSVNINYNYPTFQEKFLEYHDNVAPCKTPIGKEWTIKKDGKLYKIVIPHNVLPTLNQSNGSVVVNVPEVGPIMLKINPHFKEQSVSELEPFSLNFDEIMESTSEPVNYIVENVTSNVTENIAPVINDVDLLYDSRFCWIQPKYKHYAYSFKSNFNGFSKADMQKARRCLRNFTLSTKRLEKVLEGKKPDSGKKHNKNTIKAMNNNSYPTKNQNIGLVSFGEYNQSFDENNVILSHLDNMDLEDVLTPNVVINTTSNCEENTHVHFSNYQLENLKRLSKTLPSTSTIRKKNANIYLKACFVRMVKDKNIEKLIERDISKLVNGFKMNSNKSTRTLSFNHNTLSSKIINTEIKFKSQISYLKSLLILNEFNFEKVLYPSEFCKNNVVYAVNKNKFPRKLLENNNFVLAVKKGFIKLVECDLMLKYLKGELGPVALSN